MLKSLKKHADILPMQIITVDDREFQDLITAWKNGKLVGKYSRNGKTQLVIATRQFMLVSTEGELKKIAIKPARSLNDAENLGMQLLSREAQRGNPIEVTKSAAG